MMTVLVREAPAFVACDIFNPLPHLFSAVDVEVFLYFLLMALLILLVAHFHSCSARFVVT